MAGSSDIGSSKKSAMRARSLRLDFLNEFGLVRSNWKERTSVGRSLVLKIMCCLSNLRLNSTFSMIIKPRIKGFVCITSHPLGCLANLKDQVAIASKSKITSEHRPKRVLVIGASTGYGLSSRVTAAFSAGADTMGVYCERPPKEDKTASAGFYNSAAFGKLASEAGLSAVDVNGDAFSSECKQEVVKKRWSPNISNA